MPIIIAHRGASGLVDKENTLESFEKAIEINADQVEFDVRKTMDNKLVVCHDNILADLPVKLTKYELLEKEAEKQGYHLPLLKEVLELCKGRIYMDIEVKEHGFENRLIRELDKYVTPEEYSIKSFDDRVSYSVKLINPKIKTGLLLGISRGDSRRRLSEIFPIRRLKKCKADFVSPYHGIVVMGFVRRAHRYKYPVYVWTLNGKKRIMKFLKKGVDGIITDRPDVAMEVRTGFIDEKQGKKLS